MAVLNAYLCYIQLLHVQTNKFLLANMKEDSSWAKLKAEGSQKSHFKLLPHGTIKRVGDKVGFRHCGGLGCGCSLKKWHVRCALWRVQTLILYIRFQKPTPFYLHM